MANSRVKYYNPHSDYTDYPTHYRIYKEDGEWYLDGVDDHGNFSEGVWTFDTWREAMDSVAEFSNNYPLSREEDVSHVHSPRPGLLAGYVLGLSHPLVD